MHAPVAVDEAHEGAEAARPGVSAGRPVGEDIYMEHGVRLSHRDQNEGSIIPCGALEPPHFQMRSIISWRSCTPIFA